ncbi:ATP-dependent Clp protease proteolytic subunit [Candidatus Nesciobacter abundans]|uniref:ATP-dependent Clp protease proteolytic subunit n=1 Tax=Candidatus Nesciobacter abundans TaxID=2601668 RepID=A0A5C0UGN4_9PROT|nr:ATP-dependent Clp protease proteolytic subunit [Candidatus Nesciobacter abundans]QEK38969.1 ATP-dependent Clp protease proteolytic subunit [Candidatus Nesciobacter abundans]
MNVIPSVIDQTIKGERSYDIFSRLLKDRIIFLTGEINDEVATLICAQILFLESQSSEDIYIYINSPGGSITSALAIYDTMQFVSINVNTVCMGQACSAGSMLLCAGKKRFILKNARVLLHQPLGQMKGQAKDLDIYVTEINRLKDIVLEIYYSHTGIDRKKLESFFDRDTFFRADESKKLGIIDEIMEKDSKKTLKRSITKK